MDTSSKSWLPHQSQFGLVGQAEVCCGGPGVLTPSECVQPPVDFSVCCTVTTSSPVCGAPLMTFCYICVINVQPATSSENHQHRCIIPNSAAVLLSGNILGSAALTHLSSSLLASLPPFCSIHGWETNYFPIFRTMPWVLNRRSLRGLFLKRHLMLYWRILQLPRLLLGWLIGGRIIYMV